MPTPTVHSLRSSPVPPAPSAATAPPLHSTLTSLGEALNALSSKSPQLTALFDNLGNLSQVASRYTGTYQAFANNLAAVSTDLAGDDSDLGATLANLQKVLKALAQFTATNSSALGSSVTNLDAFAGAVAAKQQALAPGIRIAPRRARTTSRRPSIRSAPGARHCRPDSTRQVIRRDSPSRCAATRSSASFSFRSTRSQDKDPTVDLDCGVNGLLAGLPTPPSASSGPNLSLGALVGGHP